jgi:hypothetical protein
VKKNKVILKTDIDHSKPPNDFAIFRQNSTPKSLMNSERKPIQTKSKTKKKRNKTTKKLKKNQSFVNNNHRPNFQKESNYLNINVDGEVMINSP